MRLDFYAYTTHTNQKSPSLVTVQILIIIRSLCFVSSWHNSTYYRFLLLLFISLFCLTRTRTISFFFIRFGTKLCFSLINLLHAFYTTKNAKWPRSISSQKIMEISHRWAKLKISPKCPINKYVLLCLILRIVRILNGSFYSVRFPAARICF